MTLETAIIEFKFKIELSLTETFQANFIFNEIIDQIEERTENSTFYLRLDKQEFIQGKIGFKEKLVNLALVLVGGTPNSAGLDFHLLPGLHMDVFDLALVWKNKKMWKTGFSLSRIERISKQDARPRARY